jgi:phosphoglycerate kinase
MKTIDHLSFSGKKALVRVDFNVPLGSGYHITDDTRIRAAIPGIKKILGDGGSVILMSHLGRPKGGPEEKYSLKHIVAHLSRLLKVNVKFADDCIGDSAKSQAADLHGGEVLLLENLRFYKEEEKGNEEFAAKLAQLGDVYINDAFGTAHRAHASTAVIAKFFPGKSYAGYLLDAEVKNADKVLANAERPFTAIMGGAKVSDKILILERLMEKADLIIIGGGMAFTFIKALAGDRVGSSLVEDDRLETAAGIIKKIKEKGKTILIPEDVVAADAFSNDAKTEIMRSDDIKKGWMGLDIGPRTAEYFADAIKKSKTILWNGPMGVFEMSKFENGTRTVAEAVAEATANGAFSLIGGGDSAAAANKFGLAEKFSYVSTGGGALLEYIEGKELPGVKALEESSVVQ